MRDFVLVGSIFAALAVALLYPFAGVILWTWFAVQSPHEEAWSFSRALPLNLIIAIVTVFAWLYSRERKMPPNRLLIWLMLLFLAWATFNSFFAFQPDWSWQFWDRTWKTFALGFFIAMLASHPVRIHAIVWTVVLSLFYFGVKGGIFTILNGGTNRVFGAENTIIGDNNQLALALLMALPLANYLRRHSANRYISWALGGGMVLTLLAVVGTYSRGAFIGMGALGVAGFLHSRKKIIYVILGGAAGIAIVYLMPQALWDRMSTISVAESDPSFHGREVAWQVAYRYAVDHFPFGAGFYGPQLSSVYHAYFPNEEPHAAHSIFFQVLGENGFIGLTIYLFILVAAFVKCSDVISAARNRPELEWASELAAMVRMSLFVFCIAGAGLSMAYYDVFVICVSLLVPLGEIVRSARIGIPAQIPAVLSVADLAPR
jgi:putative inorganic carbon (HCO3(-)) transporter